MIGPQKKTMDIQKSSYKLIDLREQERARQKVVEEASLPAQAGRRFGVTKKVKTALRVCKDDANAPVKTALRARKNGLRPVITAQLSDLSRRVERFYRPSAALTARGRHYRLNGVKSSLQRSPVEALLYTGRSVFTGSRLRTLALVLCGFILATILPLKFDIPFVSAAVKKGLTQAIVLVVPEGVSPEEFLASLGLSGDILKIDKSDNKEKGTVLTDIPKTGPEDLVLWITDRSVISSEVEKSHTLTRVRNEIPRLASLARDDGQGGYLDLSRYDNELEIKDYDILVKATPLLYSNSCFTIELWVKQIPEAVILDSGLWRLQKSGSGLVFSYGNERLSFSEPSSYGWHQLVFTFDGINLRALVDGEEEARTKVAVLPEPRLCIVEADRFASDSKSEDSLHADSDAEERGTEEGADNIRVNPRNYPRSSASMDEDAPNPDPQQAEDSSFGLCDLEIKKSGLGSLRIFSRSMGKKDVVLLYNELAKDFGRLTKEIVREEPEFQKSEVISEEWVELESSTATETEINLPSANEISPPPSADDETPTEEVPVVEEPVEEGIPVEEPTGAQPPAEESSVEAPTDEEQTPEAEPEPSPEEPPAPEE